MRHPKGLYLICTVEMWERFSYYGMRALLVLFLTAQLINGGLGFNDSDASLIYGIFTGLIYFTPLIGGYLADRYLGQRRAISIGLWFLIAGQITMAYATTAPILYTALLLQICGNGLFKPSSTVIVGSLYPEGDSRIDSAYTIFYMGINLGSFFSPIVTGWLAVNYGFKYGFLAAAAGLILGYLNYVLLSNRYLGEVCKHPVSKNVSHDGISEPISKEERHRIWVIAILTLFAIAFFAGFEQAGCSMTLFSEKYVDRQVLDFNVPTAWLQSINPLFILLLAPLFSLMWTKLGERGKNPSIPVKMGLGLIMLGIGFILMIGAVFDRGGDIDTISDTNAKASVWFIFFAYMFHTIGELCLSPIGLSMVSRLAPVKLASMLMGVWMASSAVANFLAGYLSSFTSTSGYFEIYAGLTISSIVLGFVLIFIRKPLLKMSYGRI